MTTRTERHLVMTLSTIINLTNPMDPSHGINSIITTHSSCPAMCMSRVFFVVLDVVIRNCRIRQATPLWIFNEAIVVKVAITLIIHISSTLAARSNQLREEDGGQY